MLLLGGMSGKAWAIGPGPLSTPHSEMDSFSECNNCHTAGDGVPDSKCLSCHTHQPLRIRIQAGVGFHASSKVRGKGCESCHREHLETRSGSGIGRKSLIDWRPFGGRKQFDHELTGWKLEGEHRKQSCTTCHRKTYPKTKSPSYLGQRQECTTCHFGVVDEEVAKNESTGGGGGNPHQFVDVALTDCRICHNFDSWKVADIGATRFNHDNTSYPLTGLHTKEECVGCHGYLRDFRVEEDFQTCEGCHEDSHLSVISAKHACSSCHSSEVTFSKTIFNHGQVTGWPRRGKHRQLKCKYCHEIDTPPTAPSSNCVTCHKDIHKGRFRPKSCEVCHTPDGFDHIIFDHGQTQFGLTARHSTIRCQSCHRFGIGRAFERLSSTACASCHEHKNAHCGQFGEVKCQICHIQGGDLHSKFEHSLTRLPLEYGHQTIDCERCHRLANLGDEATCRNTIKYTGLSPHCSECHIDVHNNDLGDNCSKCHRGGMPFNEVVFDHDRDSDFPLLGFHNSVECEFCHPKRKFRLGSLRCVSCHLEDDPHQQALGDDCESCHDPTGGAEQFDHSVQTEFPLEGTHAQIGCERCHFQSVEKDKSVEKAPSGAQPVTATREPLDLQFRRAGKDCRVCHADPHKVRKEGIDCGQCHNSEVWNHPPKNGYHETVGFRFAGAHTVVGCQLCHEGAGSLTGRGERCIGCHVQDDFHAGSLGSDCGRCHEQSYWLPSTFSHTDVGFILQGVHRTLDCRSCHQAGNFFIGNQCMTCHLNDYRNAGFHQAVDARQQGNVIRVGGGSYDCGRCHTQFTFSGALVTPR